MQIFDLFSISFEMMLIIIIIIFGLLILITLTIINRIIKNKGKIPEEIEKDHIDKAISELEKLENIKKSRKEIFEKFSAIVMDFFKEHLKIKQETTYEEISKELKSKNMLISSELCNYISYKKYSGEDISPEKLFNLIETFKKIVKRFETKKIRKIRKLKFEDKFQEKPEQKKQEQKPKKFSTLKHIMEKMKVKKTESEKKEKPKKFEVNKKIFREGEKKRKIKNPKEQEKISGIDNLERIKEKIKKRKKRKVSKS